MQLGTQFRLTLSVSVAHNSSIWKEVKEKQNRMKLIVFTLAAFLTVVLASPVPEAEADSEPNYHLGPVFEDGDLVDYPEALSDPDALAESRGFPGRFRPHCVCYVSPCSCFGRPWGK